MPALLPVPPVVGWHDQLRLGRDCYVRIASNDYSVEPTAIGRVDDARADLERAEHASLLLTSNLPFSSWGGVFGDRVVAAAMIDRIVHHHADVLTLKGASYRLRNRRHPAQHPHHHRRHHRISSHHQGRSPPTTVNFSTGKTDQRR